MAIEFHCPQCKRLMRTPDNSAGKKGKCPHCGEIAEIPRPKAPSQSNKPVRRSAVTAPAAPSTKKIEFPCSQCGNPVRAPASQAGKKGKCPNCGAIFRIPAADSVVDRTPAKSTPGLTPLKGTSGLMPLDDSAGLTPLDPLTPSGLTPLNEPPGLTPLAQDPLGDLSSLAYSAPAAQVNPYRAPAAVAMPQVRRRRSGDFGYVEVLSCAWYTFWDNWTTCLLAPLLLIVLYVGVGIAIGVLMFLFRLGAQALQRIPDFPMVVLYGAALVMMVLLFLVAIFMGLFVQAGMAYISSAMVRGKNVSASDVFAGAPFILPLLGATIVQTLISFALGMVLGLPIGALVWLTQSPLLIGIAYFLSFCLNMLVAILLLNTQFLIVDQEQGVFSAISESVNSMKDKIPVTVALFLTVSVGLVAFLVITLGLGILLAFPFLWVFLATIYAKATGQKTPF